MWTVIFATLPQSSVIREYREFKGTSRNPREIADEIPLAGMHLFSGFLLGGEEILRSRNPGRRSVRT